MESRIQHSSESRSDETGRLSSKLKELTQKLEQSRLKNQEVLIERDRQVEIRLDAESKLEAGNSREKRLIEKLHNMEERCECNYIDSYDLSWVGYWVGY